MPFNADEAEVQMEKEQFLRAAKTLCGRWQSIQGQLFQINNPQIKTKLIYEEHTLERSFGQLMMSYRAYLKQEGVES